MHVYIDLLLSNVWVLSIFDKGKAREVLLTHETYITHLTDII